MNFVPREETICKSEFSFFIFKLKLAFTLLRSKKIILMTKQKNVLELNTVNFRPGEILQNIETVYNNVVAEMDVDMKINQLVNGE